jgi:hypothetical protein
VKQSSLIVIVLLAPIITVTPQSPTPVEYREVRCRVVEEAGWPVANTEVVLFGLNRDALNARFDLNGTDRKLVEKCRGWRFRTDKDGYFTARLGKFVQYEHEQATGMIEPGYGRFYFVVQKNCFAGGVSRELLNLDREELAEYQTRQAAASDIPTQEGEEWESDPYLLADGTNPELIKIEVRRGIEVIGQIQDTTGRPVAHQDVDLFLDLHADSHTGHGNEFFSQSAISGCDGRFRFEHVYPNTFYLELLDHSAGPPYWIKTRIRNRWVDAVEDEITPRYDEWDSNRDEKSIPVLIVVSRQPIYRYFGKVIDSTGRPVAGAKVEVRCSLHDPERTFEDGHDHQWKTKTDRNGHYSVRVGWRFVNAIWVYANGYKDDDSGVQEDIFAPGQYDFTLTRK